MTLLRVIMMLYKQQNIKDIGNTNSLDQNIQISFFTHNHPIYSSTLNIKVPTYTCFTVPRIYQCLFNQKGISVLLGVIKTIVYGPSFEQC
ncbi:hypothetical protein TTHERM_001264988 (macronuclear) [Tetrahymena thermophila SB210]|uniref:Uncharacterized protein n=1 Tax=Tetrahymena thermophila (strain SB210) TaxID=312017 RepID=W7X0L6_TETTS|nr:hypothetical protein TTHERM_001264988 [Tetrahymena thermophila SB210]EWS72685.1 hypothetical protein TTHERM_001264988 [Tetrahymena thermophila SB210]|eukprot:XP_012654761.1 hypothetical protein TTHERM_001264988 [Tetrahymena thermophila SB210]